MLASEMPVSTSRRHTVLFAAFETDRATGLSYLNNAAMQVLHRCRLCTNRTDCIMGHAWTECSATEDGACSPCARHLPDHAIWDVGCDFVCKHGYFQHGARCHRCIHAAEDENALKQTCKTGFFKKCVQGLTRCERCISRLPSHAEYSAAVTDDYSSRCPWKCSLGFSYNAEKTACVPCSWKPNNSHWVHDNFYSQVLYACVRMCVCMVSHACVPSLSP